MKKVGKSHENVEESGRPSLAGAQIRFRAGKALEPPRAHGTPFDPVARGGPLSANHSIKITLRRPPRPGRPGLFGGRRSPSGRVDLSRGRSSIGAPRRDVHWGRRAVRAVRAADVARRRGLRALSPSRRRRRRRACTCVRARAPRRGSRPSANLAQAGWRRTLRTAAAGKHTFLQSVGASSTLATRQLRTPSPQLDFSRIGTTSTAYRYGLEPKPETPASSDHACLSTRSAGCAARAEADDLRLRRLARRRDAVSCRFASDPIHSLCSFRLAGPGRGAAAVRGATSHSPVEQCVIRPCVGRTERG